MLSREQLTRIIDVDTRKFSGFDLVALARKTVDMTVEGEPTEDNGVYIKKGLRQYRVEKIGQSVKIEGLILPWIEARAPLLNRLGNVQAMIPLLIHPNGAITRGGSRISPHDERLVVLVSDLTDPDTLTSETYQENVEKIVK